MDDDKAVKKPLPLPTTTKKKQLLPLSSSFLAEVRVLSLLAALTFAITYGGLAAYNLRGDACRDAPRVLPCYKLTGAAAVGEAAGLERGVLSCSAPQAAAAALALLLSGRGRRRRALALVALAAAGANHWMYARLLGLARVGAPGDLFLGFETVALFLAAGLDLLGFVAFLLGGDDE